MSFRNVLAVAGVVGSMAWPRAAEAGEGVGVDRKDLEMAEDLEVLGEVVAQAIERFHSSSRAEAAMRHDAGGNLADPNCPADPFGAALLSRHAGRRDSGKTLATHLPGYGVVLQARAPYLRGEPDRRSSGTEKPPDEWELARRRLEGGPPPSEKEGPSREEPTRAGLIDALVQIMARNGHRLRHLADRERLTIALELEAPASDTADASPLGDVAQMALVELAQTLGDSSGNPKLRDQALTNRILSGDLHLRHGNYKEAIEAYRRAQDAHGEAAGVHAKLLHALAGAGQYDAARSLLDRLAAAEKALGPGGRAEERPADRGLHLPARIVLSADADSLEKAGTGSITLEEFRKQVQVTSFEAPASSGRRDGTGERGPVGRSPPDSPWIQGLVSAHDPGKGLVVLSLGMEQGVRVGMRFRVERGTDTDDAGLVEVVEVRADLSEARVLEGDPQRGDRVATERP